MASGYTPRITWGTSFANQLDIGYPLDNAIAYPKPRDGSEFVQSPTGVEDSWLQGMEYYLEGDLRWLPTSNITSPVTATGWDGSTGWRAFLEWVWEKNQFRWIPNKSSPSTYILSYWVSPIFGGYELEVSGDRRMRMVIRNSSSPYTGY